MTSEEYWYGNPDNLENFSHAFKKKMLLQEQNNWEIGQYVLSALQCSPVPVYLILDNKQCEKLPKYPQRPIQMEQEKQNRPSPEKCQQIQKDYLRIQILKNRYGETMLEPQLTNIKPEYYVVGNGYNKTPQQVESVFDTNGNFTNPFEVTEEINLDSLLGGM